MKKICNLLWVTAAMVSLYSCSEKPDKNIPPAPDGGLVRMTFSATMGELTRTTYSDLKVYWEPSDAITLFPGGNEFGSPTLSEDKTIATFSGMADPDVHTYYAVYPHAATNALSEGTFSVTIPGEQVAVAGGFASGANVSVAVTGTQEFQFKNLCALISFRFPHDEVAANTARITFRAKRADGGYWGLTGATTFELDENQIPINIEAQNDRVVVVAPAGGFKADTTYYVPVCPVGDCEGLEVVYTEADTGYTYTKSNDTGFALQRRTLFPAGTLPNPYDFSIVLDFESGWPFETPIVSLDNQSPAGETYPYSLVLGNQTVSIPVRFTGSTGTSGYSLTAGGLTTNIENATDIFSPAFTNRYLTSFKVDKLAAGRLNLNAMTSCAYNNTSVYFYLYSDKTIALDASGTPVKDAGTYNNLVYANMRAAKNRSQHLRLRDSGVTIRKIVLTYSVASPGPAPTQ
ncbi:MAG: hypothetical protein J6T35_00055 [Bacteroidales bacterium]|nr:hypothetical protein [Bacteroidales bacterium]